MPDYAQVDENNIVVNVIVTTHQFIRSGELGDPKSWIECSITGNIRGRYPGIGYFYDPVSDQFYPPKPESNPSFIWTKDERLGIEGWLPPIPYPGRADNPVHVLWDEQSRQWVENPDPTTHVKNLDGPLRYDPALNRMVDIDQENT